MRTAASRLALPFLTFVLLLGMCGCGAMRWHKPDGDDAAMAHDLEACRKEAQQRYGGASALGVLSPNDPRFGPMGPSQADLRMQEGQALGACMRQRGYVLVPS
jgi:hypothetical protein